MAVFSSWLDQHWFALIQSAGIVGSLLLAAITVRRDACAREAANRLLLLERHSKLWADVYQRSELSRVLSTEADLVAQPVSTAEQEFLNLVFVHFHTGWVLAKSGSTNSLEALAADLRSFLSLPIPRAVWQQTSHARDKKFVRFAERFAGFKQ